MSDIYTPPLNDTWNKEIFTQNNLKPVDVTPVLKKEDAINQ